MECKFARDFQTADRIQEELLSHGVDVHDGFKEWRADGEGWSSSFRDRAPRGPKVYYQRGPGIGLSEAEIEEINALVAERSECKANADYDRADAIFAELSDTFDVNVDDKKGEWSLIHEEYLMSPDSAFVPSEDIQKAIGKKLAERILARKNRNFDLADDIRQELRDEYVVDVDDRTKTWRIDQPEGAVWSDDDEDDELASVNVVSKEEFENDDEDMGTTVDDEEESEDEGDSSNDAEDLASLTIPQLKEKLRNAGLPVSGKKSELIERLVS